MCMYVTERASENEEEKKKKKKIVPIFKETMFSEVSPRSHAHTHTSFPQCPLS